MMAKAKVPLRQAKMAKTKLDLLRAMLARLCEKPFDDVTVKDICAAAMVSEATFFNYFQKKSELLAFFVQVWTLESAIIARDKAGSDAGLEGVEVVFGHTAQRLKENPRIMGEIIATIARGEEQWEVEELSRAEREQAFPGVEGLMDLPSTGLRSLIPILISRAVARGELPKGTDASGLTIAVISVFFGVPILKAAGADIDIGREYKRQLKLLWAGVRAGGLAPGKR
jgi:AcrR family transcriptional regulator